MYLKRKRPVCVGTGPPVSESVMPHWGEERREPQTVDISDFEGRDAWVRIIPPTLRRWHMPWLSQSPSERRIIAPVLSECWEGQIRHTVCSCSADGSPFPFSLHLVKACPDHTHSGFKDRAQFVFVVLWGCLPVAFQQGFVTEGSW